MNLNQFEKKLKSELIKKWEKNKRVFLNSIQLKKEKIKKEYENQLKTLKEREEQKLKKLEESKNPVEEKEKTVLITTLLHNFSEQIYKELLAFLTTEKGNQIIENKINDILNNNKVESVIIGNKMKLGKYKKGDFQYGFKILLNDNEEIDYSESYFNIVIKEKIYEVINDEIFGNNKDN